MAYQQTNQPNLCTDRQKNEELQHIIHKLGCDNESLKSINSILQFEFGQKHKELDSLRQEHESLKLKYHKSREELQDIQHEFQNFKQRMGKVVDLTLGTSGDLSEDITNPCRESELKNMYKKLSQNDWAIFLRQLKKGVPEGTAGQSRELRKQAEQKIKAVLRQSQEDIENIMIKMKCITTSRQEQPENTMPAKYFDLAIKEFQMAIYQKKNGCYNTDELQDIPDVLRPVIEECYKIGCLMALHNPPLLLDFDNCGQGTFPPIKTSETRKSEPFSSSVDPSENRDPPKGLQVKAVGPRPADQPFHNPKLADWVLVKDRTPSSASSDPYGHRNGRKRNVGSSYTFQEGSNYTRGNIDTTINPKGLIMTALGLGCLLALIAMLYGLIGRPDFEEI